MKSKLFFVLLLLIGLGKYTFSQQTIKFEELRPIYEKIERYYNNDYALRTEIFSYKGHQSTTVEDRSFGYIIKKGALIETTQLGIYSIQDGKVKVIIDSTELLVGVTYPDSARVMGFEKYRNDHKLKMIQKITLQQTKNGNIVDFYYAKNYQYERVTLNVNVSGLIEEMVFYYANEISYDAADGSTKKAKAKVRMVFKEDKQRELKFAFKIQEIVINTSKGLQPTESFKKFEFIDFRYQN